MTTRARRNELSLKDKVKLIKANSYSSQRQLADRFNVGRSQVNRILKRKAEFMEAYEDNECLDRKRVCVSSDYDDIDNATWLWFKRARALNMPVSGPYIQQKALELAKRYDQANFKASNGWLERFKGRHNISSAVTSGEKGCVDGIVVDDWKERLPDLISGYKPDDIYNMDETGLFYRALPDRTLAIKGQECIGGKKAKDRITLALCVSMTGEFERPLVIGRAAKPRCFKHLCLDKLPVTWKFNKKAWMTTELFNEWIGNFNKKMSAQNRKVLLMLDNAPSHPKKDLSNVKCLFLPANTTSVLQPLDQGIIQNVKMHYKRKLLNCALAKIETASSVVEVQKSVNVLDACQWAASAVSAVAL